MNIIVFSFYYIRPFKSDDIKTFMKWNKSNDQMTELSKLNRESLPIFQYTLSINLKFVIIS